ncbi:MAG: hypothetical protein ACI9SY_000380 [Candidatus Paceibacteria bacterium]|jgi:hypothetical protein
MNNKYSDLKKENFSSKYFQNLIWINVYITGFFIAMFIFALLKVVITG